MNEWQPIETAPVGEDILTYAAFDHDSPFGISSYLWETTISREVESESVNKTGRRLIIQEHEVRTRHWTGTHWEPTHWMPLPEAPK